MKRIIKYYLICIITVFCISFTLFGIISVDEQTSFITSGIAPSVITAQGIQNKSVKVLKNGTENTQTIIIFTQADVLNALKTAGYIVPSPWKNILWGTQKIIENQNKY